MGMSDYYKMLRDKVGNELIFIPSVATIIRNEAGEILFQYKGNGAKWSLPAGAIEPGEAPAEAIVREVKEETGLHVVPKKLLGVFGGSDFRYEYPNGDKVEYNVFLFECEVKSGKLNPVDRETVELRYFKVEEIPELALPYPNSLFSQPSHEETYFQWKEDSLKTKNTYDKLENDIANLSQQHWPGFEAVAFALYDQEKVYLYRHPKFTQQVLPWNEQFLGDTIILFGDYPTAIVSVERYEDMESLYSILAHELFHGFQYVKGEKRFPNEMLGISYPLIEENVELRSQERLHLYHAVMGTADARVKHLQNFVSKREKRISLIGEYIEYENDLETVEGPAWYMELKVYAEKSPLPYEKVVEKYSSYLLNKEDASIHLRRSCCSSGLFLSLLLDELSPNWKEGFFESNQTLYELLKKHLDLKMEPIDEIVISDEAKTIVKMVKNRKESELIEFQAKKGYHLMLEGDITASMIDPMNITKVENRLLHKNFLKIKVNEKEYLFQQPVLAYTNENSRVISKLHVILDAKPVEKEGTLVINDVGEFNGKLCEKNGMFNLYLNNPNNLNK
ncbi:NUDIX domain-containing protein [Bacillus sp. FJAT-49736]|nr:NUDIX domain-containing protein [Bacillus sp. FJAT-49736]